MGSDGRKPDLCPVQHNVGSDLHKNLVLMQSTFAGLNRKEVTFAALANSVSYRLFAQPFTSVPDSAPLEACQLHWHSIISQGTIDEVALPMK